MLLAFLFVAFPTTLKAQDTVPEELTKKLRASLKRVKLPATLSRVEITAIDSDHFAKTWIGTRNAGVWVYDPFNSEKPWVNYRIKDGLAEDSVTSLLRDRHGRVWVGHRHKGISIHNGNSWRAYQQDEGPLGTRVYDMKMNIANGDIWIATEMGISRYKPRGGAWFHYTRSEGLLDDAIISLSFTQRADLLALTRDGRLMRGLLKTRYEEWQTIELDFPNREKPVQLIATRDGRSYLLTNLRLYESDVHAEKWTELKTPARVTAMGVDRQQTVWFVMDGHLMWQAVRRKGGTVALKQIAFPVSVHAPMTGGIIIGQLKGATYFLPDKPRQFPTNGNGVFPALGIGLNAKTLEQLNQKLTAIEQLSELKPPYAQFLYEDYRTQGNWVGRYGYSSQAMMQMDETQHKKSFAEHMNTLGDLDQSLIQQEHSSIHTLGKSGVPMKGIIVPEDDAGALWHPKVLDRVVSRVVVNTEEDTDKLRLISEQQYRADVDEGIWRLAVYLRQEDATQSNDITVSIYQYHPIRSMALKSEPLVSRQVPDVHGGVYLNFMLVGLESYLIDIRSNDGKQFVPQAFFFDRYDTPMSIKPDSIYMHQKISEEFVAMPFGEVENEYYREIAQVAPELNQTIRLWFRLQNITRHPGGAELAGPWLRRTYRLGRAWDMPASLLQGWRYRALIMRTEDERLFNQRLKFFIHPDYAPIEDTQTGEE